MTEAPDYFLRFLDEMPVAVFALDADGHPHYANRAARDLLGRGIDPEGAVDELAAMYHAFLEESRWQPEARTPVVVRALDGAKSYVDDLVVPLPDGKLNLEVWTTPIRDARGSVRYALVVFQDITERKRAEAELRRLALEDPLTRLANRGVLLGHLGRALQRLSRSKATLALLFIDLDGFKAVNDLHGHAVGDEVLAELGDRLRQVTRGHELACRVGGDEFVIVCEDLPDAATARVVADRVLRRLNEPYTTRAGSVVVTASLGIAVTDSPDYEAVELVAEADLAMYAAKRTSQSKPAVPDEDG